SDLTNETTINGEIINRALLNVNINDSSRYMAKKVLELCPIYERYVLSEPEKKTSMADELASRTENLKSIYQNENVLPKSSESISVQKSESTSILREKPRNSRTSAIQSHENVTAPSNVIAISPSPVSHFGFVAVKDSLTRSISVLNLSDKKIQITPKLKSEMFFLHSGSTILMPKQETKFQVQFMPEEGKQFFGRI
uniref:MSP domain-containing protein n=1 Tax=Panagrolaimus sp. JU765 TaxID=591449 RepID=A0AC34R440_9BILA